MNFICLKSRIAVLLIVVFTANFKRVNAQHDTVKVMTYNVLNYGFPSTNSCPSLITSNKHAYLRTILKYENPDVLGLVKMDATPSTFTTDTIIHAVLDSVCNGCYGHSDFTNVSGYTKENMLYFKTAKFGYIGTTTIYSADPNISDINLHKLFYKSPTLSLTHDTTFLNIVLVHDKSGSSSASTRATEIQGAMSWLESNVSAPGNYIFMGDFNVQAASEACFQAMVNSSNTNTKFFDPVNQLGNWANHPATYANYLTENTRMTDPGDCGASGGMATRFIHILCTSPIMNGSKAAQYIPNSYKVIGQDGNHVNKAINASPTNTSVLSDELNALYYMSNHLPVSLKLDMSYSLTTTTAVEKTKQARFVISPNPTSDFVYVKGVELAEDTYYMSLTNIKGERLITKKVNPVAGNVDERLDLSAISKGSYLLEIVSVKFKQTFKLVIE